MNYCTCSSYRLYVTKVYHVKMSPEIEVAVENYFQVLDNKKINVGKLRQSSKARFPHLHVSNPHFILHARHNNQVHIADIL